ncbi:MAG: hypothetical protein QXS20_03035 [Candidatus Thorarchaeota archaeon]
MDDLEEFLTSIVNAKRKLKMIYYTGRNSDQRNDAKELIAFLIELGTKADRLVQITSESPIARKLMSDRKAELELHRWSQGLLNRTSDYVSKAKDLSYEHAHRYQLVMMEYLETIESELSKWIEEIETATGVPRPPKD